MRLLADENFPLSGVRMLSEAGHDIVAVALDSPGIAGAGSPSVELTYTGDVFYLSTSSGSQTSRTSQFSSSEVIFSQSSSQTSSPVVRQSAE